MFIIGVKNPPFTDNNRKSKNIRKLCHKLINKIQKCLNRMHAHLNMNTHTHLHLKTNTSLDNDGKQVRLMG